MFTFACLIPGKMEVRVLLAVSSFLPSVCKCKTFFWFFHHPYIPFTSWRLSVFRGLHTAKHLLQNYSHSILLLPCNYVPKMQNPQGRCCIPLKNLFFSSWKPEPVGFHCLHLLNLLSFCKLWNVHMSMHLSENTSECHDMEVKHGGDGHCVRCSDAGKEFNFLAIPFTENLRNRPKCDTLSSTPGGWDSWGVRTANMCVTRAVRTRPDHQKGCLSQTWPFKWVFLACAWQHFWKEVPLVNSRQLCSHFFCHLISLLAGKVKSNKLSP